MAVNDEDRSINRYNAETEADIASLKQIFNSLSKARQKLLEAVLRKLLVCSHLLSQVLPAARMNIFMFDFDSYRSTAVKDIRENPNRWSAELIYLFASSNIAILLPHAYLAVCEWNRGGLYAPKAVSLWGKDPAYPMQREELTKGTLQKRIERLILKVNEPLDVNCGDMMAMPSPPDEDEILTIPEDADD